MFNKYITGLRQYMYQFIGSTRYEKNKDIIERIGHQLVTESDFKAFMVLAVDIYESAYLKAVEDYRQHFEKLGVKVEIAPAKPSS